MLCSSRGLFNACWVSKGSWFAWWCIKYCSWHPCMLRLHQIFTPAVIIVFFFFFQLLNVFLVECLPVMLCLLYACLFTFSLRVLISEIIICLTNSFPLYFGLWQNIVNAICDDDDIRAISFVGSNTVNFFSMFCGNAHFLHKAFA